MLLPDSHENCTLENFNWEGFQNIKGEVEAFIEGKREKGLIFIGNPGVGKTHLMIGVYKKLRAVGKYHGSEVIYIQWDELVNNIRNLMYEYRVIPEVGIERALPEIPIIDDIKNVKGNIESAVLRRTIENIYDCEKIGLLSTNAENVSDLTQRWELPDYWTSRLFSRFDVVKVKGEDWRLK